MIKKYEVLQNYDENINPIENILFANDDFGYKLVSSYLSCLHGLGRKKKFHLPFRF